MRKSIAAAALAATGHIGRARRGGDARSRERNRLEPPGGAADRGRPLGGPDGRLRVPEPRQAEHRHHPGERDPRRGPGSGAELVHVLAVRPATT